MCTEYVTGNLIVTLGGRWYAGRHVGIHSFALKGACFIMIFNHIKFEEEKFVLYQQYCGFNSIIY